MELLNQYLKKKLIPRLIEWLKDLSTEKKSNSYKPIALETLTPTCDADEDDVYKSALKSAIDNPRNYNIGVTGAYGSGKSSILESFKRNHELEYNFLSISLASFNENNLTEPEEQNENENSPLKSNSSSKISKEEDARNEVNQLIELSILQQLLYHVKNNDLPNSRFQRIKRHPQRRVVIYALSFFVWLLAIVFISEPGFIKRTALWNELDWSKNDLYFAIPSFLFFAFGCVFLFFKIIRFANNSRLSKLNLKDGEIEIDRPDDRSILNRYLDEVFYFFEMTSHNVVIIEDLDRLKNSMIFTKLRELNTLLNNSDQLKGNRIVFIYALRDDLFKNKSRTKFFDVIIPVIPIINTTNSGDMFLKLIQGSDPNHSLSTDFIGYISLFIDDMRLLKNIYNEYLVYSEKIKGIPDQNKLLAMVVYKNIFPSDFVALHNGGSVINKVLKGERDKLTNYFINDLDEKIKTKQKLIELIRNSFVNSGEELVSIYVSTLWKKLGNPHTVTINRTQYSFSDLLNGEKFEALKKHGIQMYTNENGRNNFDLGFNEIEQSVESTRSFDERLKIVKAIENNNTKDLEELKQEIEVLKIEKRQIAKLSFSEIEKKINIAEVFPELKEEKNELTLYLLRHGYIDEDFDIYISFFHEGGITNDDRKFLLSVKRREILDYRYKLVKLKGIIARLQPSEFELTEILNVDLLDYLIASRDVEGTDSRLNSLLDQLVNESQRSIDFIDIYIEEGKEIEFFMEQLCHKWHNIWEYIELFSNYSDQRKNRYLELIIKHARLSDIDKINEGEGFANYIKEQQYFLEIIPDTYIEKAKSVIINLGIYFTNLEPTISESKLFDFVYKEEYYEINPQMIEFIIRGKSEEQENLSELLKKQNYSTIKASNCMPLISYIQNHIEEYVEDVFLKLEGNNEEKEEYLLELLNHPSLNKDLKGKIILKSNANFSHLSKIKDSDLYPFIAEHLKMSPVWENVYTYLETEVGEGKTKTLKEIDSSLCQFLNQKANYEELAKKKITDTIGKDEQMSKLLCNRVVFSQGLTISSFKSLHKSIPYNYPALSLNNISSEKIDYMINSGFLVFTAANFDFLRKYHSPKHIKLLELKRTDFFASIDKFKLRGNDVSLIIKSKVFSETQKINLIKSIDPNILDGEKYVCNTVCEFLASKNYFDLSGKLIESLFKYGTNDIDKIKLFNLSLNNQVLDINSISSLLLAIGHPYSRLTKKGITQKFANREENKSLISLLTKRGYNIRSSSVSKGYINIKTTKD